MFTKLFDNNKVDITLSFESIIFFANPAFLLPFLILDIIFAFEAAVLAVSEPDKNPDNNIRKIKSIVSKREIDFRPHLKTAKCLEITKILVKEFGPRAMVSTIEELELNGTDDELDFEN